MNDDLSQYDPELVWVLTTDVQYLITKFIGSVVVPITLLMRDEGSLEEVSRGSSSS